MDPTEKLITSILPKGGAVSILRRLKQEKGVVTCYINNARGTGRFTQQRVRRLGDVSEKEILNVIAHAEHADDIFEFIFYEADINRPHGGMIFMTELARASHFELPNLPEERAPGETPGIAGSALQKFTTTIGFRKP